MEVASLAIPGAGPVRAGASLLKAAATKIAPSLVKSISRRIAKSTISRGVQKVLAAPSRIGRVVTKKLAGKQATKAIKNKAQAKALKIARTTKYNNNIALNASNTPGYTMIVPAKKVVPKGSLNLKGL
jgi:hypothetical protein